MSGWASTDFYQKDQKIVWSKVLMIREKLQITAAFLISAAKFFLPVQLIHEGKSKRCVPKVRFPSDFNFTFTPNHRLKLGKCKELFQFMIFSYFPPKKGEPHYSEEQRALIIMDTFKDQDNGEGKQLFQK